MQIDQISRYKENMDAASARRAVIQKTGYSPDSFTASSAGMAAALGINYSKSGDNSFTVFNEREDKKDILSDALSFDPKNSKNYMVVMSNTLSDEDFAKAMESGEKPSETSPEDSVTILDEIKVTLAKSGVYIPGYTDDLDEAAVKEIAGSSSNARSIENALKAADIPASEKNISDISIEMKKAESVTELSDGAKKYLLQNELPLNPDSLYKAAFSGDDPGNAASGGYFSSGSGYLSKRGGQDDLSAMDDMIRSAIKDMGFSENDENVLSDASWLLKKDIPLTKENLTYLKEINELELPLNGDDVALSAARAISAGLPASEGIIGQKEDPADIAASTDKKTQALTGDEVGFVLKNNEKLTLKNLFEAYDKSGQNPSDDEKPSEKEVAGRANLAKIQLMMSAQANLKLMKLGINIELEPLDRLVSHFEKEEALFRSTEVSKISEAREDIKTLPAETLGLAVKQEWLLHGSFTIEHIRETGNDLKLSYEKANESYETMMTTPRADLGDNIKAAFRNIKDILTEINLEPTEENQKAARILGYNTMPVSAENIYAIKDALSMLQKVVDELTPSRALTMLKDGVNPLSMNLDVLSDYLSSLKTPSEDSEKYSTFLQKLDHNKEIDAEEKDAYIGIYRLLRQIEKGDESAIGGVIKKQQEMTLSNLLSAVRTEKKGYIDLKINESFGFLSEVARSGSSITDQIERYFKNHASGLINDLSAPVPLGEDGDPILKEEIASFREAAGADQSIFEELFSSEITPTPSNIIAQKTLSEEGSVYETMMKHLRTSERKDDIRRSFDKIRASLSEGEESLKESFEEFSEYDAYINEYAENALTDRIDVRALSLISKQLSVISRHAENDNYYIPVEIGGTMSAVHVQFITGTGEGTVSISLTAGAVSIGGITAMFTGLSDRIEGMISVENEEDLTAFSSFAESFKQIVVEEFQKDADISCVQGKNSASPANIKGNISSNELYRIAGRWIDIISQEVSE